MLTMSSHGPRILLVTTNPDIQQLLRITFDQSHVDLLVASDTSHAQAVAVAVDLAAVIIVETFRSPLAWVEVAKNLRSEPILRSIPMIAIGWETEPKGRRLAVQAGIDAYFQLPFSPFRLLQTMESLLMASRISVG